MASFELSDGGERIPGAMCQCVGYKQADGTTIIEEMCVRCEYEYLNGMDEESDAQYWKFREAEVAKGL